MIKLTTTALGFLAGAALIGCGGSSDDNAGSTGASGAQQAPPSTPKGEVKFVTPQNGAKTPSTMTVKVALKDFHLNGQTVGQAPRPGQGHLHFRMDDGKFDTPRYSGLNGKLGAKLGVTHKYSPSITPTITYSHLPAGKHKLEVDLANNNHTNVGPEDTVTFTVK